MHLARTPLRTRAVVALGPTVGAVVAAGLADPLLAQRHVLGNVIDSSAEPAVRIVVDSAFAFVGGQTFTLYDVARAEQYLFVDADDGRVERLYWFQFEGFLERVDRSYDYSGDPTVDIAGRPFHRHTRFYPPSGFAGRPGSDGDRARDLLARQGYQLGSDLARVRLVWLLGDPPRDELMIIYVEDLALHGTSVEALREDPRARERMAATLTERAIAGLEISSPRTP